LSLSPETILNGIFGLISQLNIPVFLQPSDLINTIPDEKVVETQVSYLYHFFSNCQPQSPQNQNSIEIEYDFHGQKGTIPAQLDQQFGSLQADICQRLQISQEHFFSFESNKC
jgi:hypothetical protein